MLLPRTTCPTASPSNKSVYGLSIILLILCQAGAAPCVAHLSLGVTNLARRLQMGKTKPPAVICVAAFFYSAGSSPR
jgi:hypothetical protein